MKIQGIYKIRNCVNGKVYIGQSIDIENRIKVHKYNTKTNIKHPLYNAFRKYGIDNFEFIIIEHVIDGNKLNKREQHYLDYYESYNPEFGYNICRESTTTRGYKHTDETKKKFSETHKGKKLSKEHIQAIIKFQTGRKHTDEELRKISEGNKGKIISKEQRQKLSERAKKQWADPIYRENLSKIKNDLYKNNPELKNKISNSVKNLWKDEDYRNNQVENRKREGKLRRIILDIDKVKNLYLTQNFTIQQVADMLNVDNRIVSVFLKENNIQKPYIAYSKSNIKLDKVKDLYLTQNFTIAESAKLLGVCAETLSNFLKENNIRKSQRAYCKNKIKDADLHNLIDNPINQELINENTN